MTEGRDRDDAPNRRPADDADIDLASLPRCPECGYILYKLARMRCPECGTPVRVEDLCPPPDRLEIERRARIERRLGLAGGTMLVIGLGLFAYSLRHGWAARVCLVSPLVGMTIAWLGRQIYLGEPLHMTLMFFGVFWLITGAILGLL